MKSRELLDLGIGYPQFTPPKWMSRESETAFRKAGKFDTQEKQVQLVEKVWRQFLHAIGANGMNPDPRDVRLFNHATDAIGQAILGVTNIGDGVAISQPTFPEYANFTSVYGRKPIFIAPYIGSDGTLATDAIEHAIKRGAKAFVFANPENPMGTQLRFSEVQKLADIAYAHKLTLIADEVFEPLTYGIATIGRLEKAHPLGRFVAVHDTGKLLHLHGAGIALSISSPGLANQMEKKTRDLYGHEPDRSRLIHISRILRDERLGPYLQNLLATTKENIRTMQLALGQIGWTVNDPQAGPFVVAQPPDRLGIESDEALQKHLYERINIQTRKLGDYFQLDEVHRSANLRTNQSQRPGVRMSLNRPSEVVEEAVDRIKEFSQLTTKS